MTYRMRQFSDIRSRSNSRAHSVDSLSIWDRQRRNLQFSQSSFNHDDCVNCVNKKLAVSRIEHQKLKRQRQMKQSIENIKRINAMRDYQKQKRQQMLAEAARFNKSQITQKDQMIKNTKKMQDIEHLKQIQQKQKQLQRQENDFKESRRQLQSTYHQQLKEQLQKQRSRKILALSRIKSQSAQQMNRHLLLERQNQRYVNLMTQQRKKCNRQNKRLINQKSTTTFLNNLKDKQQEIKHVQAVQNSFSRFTQFQPLEESPYKLSRTILSSENNPQDVFSYLKRLENEKKQSKKVERKLNHQERIIELKKQDELNYSNIQKKLSNMKSYVDDLTNQLIEKRNKQRQSKYYEKYYQPKKSKTDYFTEEMESSVKSCNSCSRVLEEKFF